MDCRLWARSGGSGVLFPGSQRASTGRPGPDWRTLDERAGLSAASRAAKTGLDQAFTPGQASRSRRGRSGCFRGWSCRDNACSYAAIRPLGVVTQRRSPRLRLLRRPAFALSTGSDLSTRSGCLVSLPENVPGDTISMPGMLGEALFVAHKLRDEMLFRAPVGTVLGVVTMVVRPHHH